MKTLKKLIKENYLYILGCLCGLIFSTIIAKFWIFYTEDVIGYLAVLDPFETAYACFALIGMAFIGYKIIVFISRHIIRKCKHTKENK